MTTQPVPVALHDQAEYQQGQMDGQRYYIDGHTELWQKYTNGSSAYREGFKSAANHPRTSDPDFAS